MIGTMLEIQRIGKKLFIIFFFVIFTFQIKIYATECKIKNSDYLVDFPFWAYGPELEFQEKYPIVFYDQNIRDYKDEGFIFIVKNNETQLSYNLNPLLFADYISLDWDYVYFLPQKNGVNILFERSDLNFFLIQYDFYTNRVEITPLGYLSDLFYYLSIEGVKITSSNIIDYFNNKKIIFDGRKFYYKRNDFCDYRNNFDFISEVTISDSIDIKVMSKDGVRLQKIPQSISEGTSFFTKRLIQEDVEYSTKSYLVEGNLKYLPQNLNKFSDIPWCPTISYKDEVIYIKTKNPIEGLYFGNGYYRSDKKYLYKNNCRVKELEITFLDSNYSQKVTLEDSGYLQFIPLINVNEKNIKIKILSVYEGDKYSDLCINCILPLRRWGWNEYQMYTVGR